MGFELVCGWIIFETGIAIKLIEIMLTVKDLSCKNSYRSFKNIKGDRIIS